MHATLDRRTSDIIRNHRKRAAQHGAQLDFDLGDLRCIIRSALQIGLCPYCKGRLTVSNFSLDHAQPVCRGGTFELANYVICCARCNTVKAALSKDEFIDLLRLITSWEPAAAANTIARLFVGARKVGWQVRSGDDSRRSKTRA